MKDFEKDLIYYPNPDPIEEPRFVLNSVDELEKSEKYSVICNGTERVVYHTDSFDYVVVVDNEAYDLEISIHTPFKELAIRPTSFGIEPSVKGETVHIHLDEPRKFTVETDGGLHDALFVFCSRRIEKPENTTICFEKGKAYNVGVLTLKSNDTVYIEDVLLFPDVSMQNIVKIFPSWETELSTEPAGICRTAMHIVSLFISNGVRMFS